MLCPRAGCKNFSCPTLQVTSECVAALMAALLGVGEALSCEQLLWFPGLCSAHITEIRSSVEFGNWCGLFRLNNSRDPLQGVLPFQSTAYTQT